MIIVDTHTHAGLNWFEPVEMLIHQMNMNSVDKAVLVQHGRPETGGFDHTYLFECVERFPGRFVVVGIVDLTKTDAEQQLERLASQGAVGVRLNAAQRSMGSDPLAIWRKARQLGMVVSCPGGVDDFGSDEFSNLVESFPDLTIVIEHLAGGGQGVGFSHVRGATSPEPPYTAFSKALEIARFLNVFIKIPGLGEISSRPTVLLPHVSFTGTLPFIEMTREAFGVERMMFGSDYPPVSIREGYRNALQGVMNHPAFQTQEEREWVMGKSAMRAFKLE